MVNQTPTDAASSKVVVQFLSLFRGAAVFLPPLGSKFPQAGGWGIIADLSCRQETEKAQDANPEARGVSENETF
jgi:hypothetical protein